MRRVWKAACIAAGVEISLYEGTKHSRATDLLRQGVSERVLQVLLGHRDARSTRRYARLADEALVDAIRPRCGSSVDPLRKRPKKRPKNQLWWRRRESNLFPDRLNYLIFLRNRSSASVDPTWIRRRHTCRP